MITFPLRLNEELHEEIHRAAFFADKKKHQFIIDAIKKELEYQKSLNLDPSSKSKE